MLMSAAAEKLGLVRPRPDDSPHRDLDEARRLITALAGLVTASAEYLGPHAGPVRDGLKSLQLAFRESSAAPDEPGPRPRREVHRARSGRRCRDSPVCSTRPLSHTHFPGSANILAAYDRHCPTGEPPGLPVCLGARGGRLDDRHHRHPVADRQRLAAVRGQSVPASSSTTTSSTSPTPASPGRSSWPCWRRPWPPASASPGGSWCVYMVAAIGWNIGDLVTGDRLGDRGHRRGDRLVFHIAAIAVPGAGPQRVLGEGPPRRAGQGGRRRWSPGWRSARSSAGDCSNSSPARWPAKTGSCTRLNRVSAFAGAGSGVVHAAIRTCSSTRCSACSARWP